MPLLTVAGNAEDNGIALTPPMGWSSWSSLRFNVSASKIEAEAAAMHNHLQASGYQYINIDDGWYADSGNSVDANGRWEVNTSTFPGGIPSVANYVHGLGLKLGLYLTPGMPKAAYNNNSAIAGTTYHARDVVTTTAQLEPDSRKYAIDYSKPGAQAYVNSVADELASWGVDFLKLDYTSIPADVKAWSIAIAQCGRKIHLELSNGLALSNAATWQQYSNGWRIENDIENYGGSTLTTWQNVSFRFNDRAAGWTFYNGPGAWSDLDSLEIGNGNNDGLTPTERQSQETLWAISAAPLLIGADLTNLDSGDLTLLTNSEVLAIDQGAVPGSPLAYSNGQEVWRARQNNGQYAVAMFNRNNASGTSISVNWTSLGFTGPASVRNLWTHSNLGTFASAYTTTLDNHGSGLYLVTPQNPAMQYLADSPVNSLTGAASVNPIIIPYGGPGNADVASNGANVHDIGEGATLTFNKVMASEAGPYSVTILYFNGDASRTANISVNGGPAVSTTFAGTGSFTALGSKTITLSLNAGANTIEFSNPTGYSPDLDSITVQSANPSSVAGTHAITNDLTGQDVDNDNKTFPNGDPTVDTAGVVQFAPNGNSTQAWTFTQNADTYWTIKSNLSGYVLDDPNSATANNTQIVQWPSNGGTNQEWLVMKQTDGSYEIVNRASGSALDGSSSTTNGFPLTQWGLNGGPQQRWLLK